MKSRTVLSVVALLFAFGCASAPAPPAPAPPVVAANDNLNAVLWTQRAVEHDLVFREIYRAATERLPAALADPEWDALAPEDRDTPYAGLPPAVILDVDETVLDNSPSAARDVRSGAEFNEAAWADWCKEEIARPLPGAVEFTRFAAEHGVAVFYLSNRNRALRQVTLDNLRKAGLPVADDDSFLGLGVLLPGCEQIGSDKSCRRRLVGRTHRVLMQFGDQIGDFVDPVANTNEGRAAAVAPFADWIGERWFFLPGPTYGSWEPAQFGNNWALSREARRKAKIDALKTD